MTNEEIIKRFQFDLEIGVFKRGFNNLTGLVPFNSNIDCYLTEKFLSILYFLGFDVNPKLFLKYTNIILLNPVSKKVPIFEIFNGAGSSLSYKDIPKFNEIPDYIREYKLADE